MYLISAPAAKNPGTAELTTRTFALPCSSASIADSRPSINGAPSALAGGRDMTMCMTSPRASTWTTCSLVPIPVHRSGDENVTGQPAPEDALHLGRGRDQPLESDSCFDAHLLKHRDQILAGDVSGRPGGNRASAELAERRLEARDTGL